MTNPFADISDPAILRAMVQDGVKCEACNGRQWPQVGPDACPVCCGPGKISGKVPLSNADLDALAACWCEGEWVYPPQNRWVRYTSPDTLTFDDACNAPMLLSEYFRETMGFVAAYTTSPDAAMRLQVQHKLSTEPWGLETWRVSRTAEPAILIVNESLCHAITTAALVAALTEAMQATEHTEAR